MKDYIKKLYKIENKLQNGSVPYLGFITLQENGKYQLSIGLSEGKSYEQIFDTQVEAFTTSDEYLKQFDKNKLSSTVIFFGEENILE